MIIKVVQDGLHYKCSFPYDPDIIELIKQVPGRMWLPNEKVWAFPVDKLGFFYNQFMGTPYEDCIQTYSSESLGVSEVEEKKTFIPDIDVSNVPFYIDPNYKPYQHQIDFMKYAIAKHSDGFIVGDEMRMGKTAEVLNYAEYMRHVYGYKHCLIICCVNSSKHNWMSDIETHLGPYQGTSQGYILGTRKVKRRKTKIIEERYDTGGKEKLDDLLSGHMYGDESAPELPYFIITNIESIRYSVGRNYAIADKLVEMINSKELNCIAIDEIHLNTSPTSSQGKVLLTMKRKTQKKCQWIPMTGTLLKNSPLDAFLPLKLVDGHDYRDFYGWRNHFAVFGGFNNAEVIAYRNIPQLSDMLSAHMIRRKKTDVYDIPPKLKITEYVENTPTQQKLYEQIAFDLMQRPDEVKYSSNPMAKFMRLRQVNGSPELVDDSIKVDDKYISKNAKIEKLLDLLHEIVDDRGEKVVIYSNWVDPLRTLYKFISNKYKVCCYTGTMKDSLREKHKRIFVNNPDYKVMIGTIGALGTAHTLTVADNVIFYDEPWVPSDREQAEDRIYGLNTTKSKNFYTIITKGTVDDTVHKILNDKDMMSKYIVDGKLDIKRNPELIYMLLGSSNQKG